METVFQTSLGVIARVWIPAFLGTFLMVIAVATGWALTSWERFLPVRLTRWWVHDFIMPRLRSPSWLKRMVIILVNNFMILALLVGLGQWLYLALVGIALVGVNLGIGLRLMTETADPFAVSADHLPAPQHRRIRIGFLLNMLEPPAIMLTLGLSLQRSIIPLSSLETWSTFLIWVIPLIVLAASGESLWMGVALKGTASAHVSRSSDHLTGSQHASENHEDIL